jgi:hypothetical protein
VEDSKPKLPKAMVKPQVLTHVIEGFVIQEASEPFPMNRNGESCEEPPSKLTQQIYSSSSPLIHLFILSSNDPFMNTYRKENGNERRDGQMRNVWKAGFESEIQEEQAILFINLRKRS